MNLSGYSNVASASTPPVTNRCFVQGNFATPQMPRTSVTIPFTAAQAAGNLNVLVASWNDSVTTVTSVTDTAGNVYAPALAPTTIAGTATQVMYYAKGIAAAAAGSNQLTVSFSGAATFPDVRIGEYTGIDPTNPLDGASGQTGTGTLGQSGPVVTNGADLLVAGSYSATVSTGPGVGYTQRLLTSPDGDILEDMVALTPNMYTASAPMASIGWWVVQAAAFRLSSIAPPDTTPPVVAFTSPTDGDTVSGTITVAISATDTASVQAVQLLVDGLPMGFPEHQRPLHHFAQHRGFRQRSAQPAGVRLE